MSDSKNLGKIYEQFATRTSLKVISEAFSHSISKTPVTLTDDDIKFLMQFDEDYWRQVIQKRYDLFARYVANLWQLRKVIYQSLLKDEAKKMRKIYSDKRFDSWPDFVKNNHINMQAQANAKAAATERLKAGEEIDRNLLKQPPFDKLDDDQKKVLQNVINNINYHYLARGKQFPFEGLVKGNRKPEEIDADPFLASMAKSIEGEPGKEGFDINNPRLFSYSPNKDLRPGEEADAPKSDKENKKDIEETKRIVMDGFKLPTFQQIKDSIRKHLMAIGTGKTRPVSGEGLMKSNISRSEGLPELNKQNLRQEINAVKWDLEKQKWAAEKSGRGRDFVMPGKNEIEIIAKNRLKQKMQVMTNKNFKKFLIRAKTGKEPMQSGEEVNNIFELKQTDKKVQEALKNWGLSLKDFQDIKKIQDPFSGLGYEVGADGESFVKSGSEDLKMDLPYVTTTVNKIIRDKDNKRTIVPTKVKVPQLTPTDYYKDLHLGSSHPNVPWNARDLVTDLAQFDDKKNLINLYNPDYARGPKIFDKHLFDSLLSRINELKDPKTDQFNRNAAEQALKVFGLDKDSKISQVVEASKRPFLRSADPSEFGQGQPVTGSFIHHPGRTSAQADFLAQYHDPGKYDNVINALKRGVTDPRGLDRYDFVEFVRNAVTNWLTARVDAKESTVLSKAIMSKAKEPLINLAMLRVMENLRNPELLTNVRALDEEGRPIRNEKGEYVYENLGNSTYINQEISKELTRYFDQNLMVGSRRKRQDFIEAIGSGLANDPKKYGLSCEQGKKGGRPGTCMQGLDLRSINDLFGHGLDAIQALEDDDAEEDGDEEDGDMNKKNKVAGSIVAERKKVAKFTEAFKEIIVSIYALNLIDSRLHQVDADGKVNEKAARANALHNTTDVVKAHIDEEDTKFFKAMYNVYSNLYQALVTHYPEEVGKSVPSGLRKETEKGAEMIDWQNALRRMRRRKSWEDKESIEGDKKGALLRPTIDDANLTDVIRELKTIIRLSPSRAPNLYYAIRNKLNPTQALKLDQMVMKDVEKIHQQQAALWNHSSRADLFNHLFFQRTHSIPEDYYEPEIAKKEAVKMTKKWQDALKIMDDKTLADLASNVKKYWNVKHNLSVPGNRQITRVLKDTVPEREVVRQMIEDEVDKRNLWGETEANMKLVRPEDIKPEELLTKAIQDVKPGS